MSVPHSATRQAIIDCAHGTLKYILKKHRGEMCHETPQSSVAKASYTPNHLRVLQNTQNLVLLNHFLS